MDYQRRSSDLEGEAEQMDDRTDELERDIAKTKGEWESRKSDGSVPGAQPTEGEAAPEQESEDDDADSSPAESTQEPDADQKSTQESDADDRPRAGSAESDG